MKEERDGESRLTDLVLYRRSLREELYPVSTAPELNHLVSTSSKAKGTNEPPGYKSSSVLV